MALGLLVVEHGEYFADVIGGRLCRNEFRLSFAGQLGGATRIISRKPVDVGLVDLSSLKGEGIHIIEEIKRVQPQIEIITINTHDLFANSIAAMKAGAFDDFLIPIEINTLINRIRAAGAQKKDREKQRMPILQRCQDAKMAVAFAEAGELERSKIIAETGKFSTTSKEVEKEQGRG